MHDEKRDLFISRLYEEYFDRLNLFCQRMVGYSPELFPYAEDCVQDVFHTAIKKYKKLENHPDVEGWLFRSCINHMNNVLKTYYGRKKRHAYSMDGDNVADLFDPKDSFHLFEEKQEYREILNRIYSLLLDGEKEIFDQYFLENNDLEQVSKQVGKSVSSIKSTIYRIRRRIKKTIPKDLIILFLIGTSFFHMSK